MAAAPPTLELCHPYPSTTQEATEHVKLPDIMICTIMPQCAAGEITTPVS